MVLVFSSACLDRPGGSQLRLNRRALLQSGLRHLHDPVDEQPQAQVGRHPPGAGVRRGQQAELL